MLARGRGADALALQALDEMAAAALPRTERDLELALRVAALSGDAALATATRAAAESVGLELSDAAVVLAIEAHSRAGDLVGVASMLPGPGRRPTLPMVTEAIRAYGASGDIDSAMAVYDKLIEFQMAPDDELNQVLIHVCGIDPISVAVNAAQAQGR